MGNLFSFSLISSLIILSLLPVIYFLVNRCMNFKFNRRVIMLSILIATLFPFLSIFNYKAIELPEVSGQVFRYFKSEADSTATNELKSQVVSFILLIYIAGLILLIIKEFISYVRLFILISKAKRVKKDGYILCLVDEKNISPFSWGNFIVFPEGREIESPILLHEIAHTHFKHWRDILTLDVFCIFTWYNPFSWVIKSLAKLNHEFEADNRVIQKGVDIKEYQKLLILKVIGEKSFSITNNFSLNKSQFRKRVLFMNRKDTNGRQWIAILGVPSIIVSIFIISSTPTAAMLSNISDYSLKQLPFIRKDIPVSLTDETNIMPDYNGGYEALYQLLYENIRFPETFLNESGINKKLVINLSIDERGEINDIKILQSPGKETDEEIRRALKLTEGNWKPATISGYPVRSTINLPITFSTM